MTRVIEKWNFQTAAAWTVAATLVSLLSLLFYSTRATQPFSSPHFDSISLSLVIISASLILLPATRYARSALINSLFCATLLSLLVYWLPDSPLSMTSLMRLATITFCLSLLLFSLRVFVSCSLMLMLLAVLLLSPVWSSPLMDNFPLAAQWVNLLLSLNPFTHLAIAIDFDYLRQDWLYRHSAFGSLSFRYPGFATTSIVYLFLFFALQLLQHLIKPHNLSQGGIPQ
jgi:hypothetical protein